MLKNLTAVLRPSSIEEACSLLADKGRKHAILAGGTHIAGLEDPSIEVLVDLGGLHLSYIRKSPEGFSIGAMTPVQDVFKSAVLTGPAGDVLRSAAGKIGSTLLRNAVTVGGNLTCVFPWSDLPPVFLALDASVLIRRGPPKKTVLVKNLLEQNPRQFLDPNDIVVEIGIPNLPPATGTAFAKFAKTSNDYALITVASRLTLAEGRISGARIALNGCVKRPQRRENAEQHLLGKAPSVALLREAARMALNEMEMTQDFRASLEYRQEVAEVLVRRCLEEALEKAR